MQNRYVGDHGDFGKFGLLRRLCGLTDPDTSEPDLRLGVVWYLFHDPRERNRDGGHIEYLVRTPQDDKSRYRDCDPDLWEKLRDLLFRGARYVHCAEGEGLLPERTAYFGAPLGFPPYMNARMRREIRQAWIDTALRTTRNADLVFLDPDNGLAEPRQMYLRFGPKYTYLDDIQEFFGRGQSVIFYQQANRDAPGRAQVRGRAEALEQELGIQPIPLWFTGGTARVFFVIPQPCHRERIEARIGRMLAGCWGQHFELVEVPHD